MATRKIQNPVTINQTADQEFINSILTESTTEVAHIKSNSQESTGTREDSSKKVLVNFKMNKENLEQLRAYCRENDMTLTAGIKRAIRKMLNENGGNK